MTHDWPGNVRELQNVIERALIGAQAGRLALNLPTAGVGVAAATQDEQPRAPLLLNAEQLRELERHNLVAVLRETRWRIAGKDGAVEFLGMHPAMLASRLKSMGTIISGPSPPPNSVRRSAAHSGHCA